MSDGSGMWFGGGFMWIFWILLIVVIVWVIKAATDSGTGNNNSHSEESPLEILKKRYARGEIDEAEYERRRKELEN